MHNPLIYATKVIGQQQLPLVNLCQSKNETKRINQGLLGMFSRQIEKLKESFEEKLENTFEIYKDAIREHAYQSAMNNLEDDYVPVDEFIAEQDKVEVCNAIMHCSNSDIQVLKCLSNWLCMVYLLTSSQIFFFGLSIKLHISVLLPVKTLKRKVSELEGLTSSIRGLCAVPTVDQSCQTHPYKSTEAAGWYIIHKDVSALSFLRKCPLV